MKTETPVTQAGCLIGRFQVPEIHKGQRQTIEAVFARHKRVIILLGVSPVKMSRRDPLDFITRKLMIEKAYPKAIVMPIKDMPDDKNWSKGVDSQIEAAVGDMTVTMYGSRDSFIPHYFGRYPTIELQASLDLSGSQAREAASTEIRAERGYRVGVIYAAFNRYPISYQCVDAIIWRRVDGNILLGRKKTDQAGLYRFVGGFVQPEDESLDRAAKREAMEETGDLEFAEPQYLFSARVEDWRYRKEKDKILTAVFSLEYLWGTVTPSDDIDYLKWFSLTSITPEMLVPEHREIWNKAKTSFP